jgi:DNA-binding NtrC family response regulator
MPLPTILIVDDEKHTREGLGAALEGDHETLLARDADEAFNLLDSEKIDLVLTDLRMSGKSGMSVIDKTLAMPTRPVCVMMTAYGNVETAVEAMRRGAYDFLTKPVSLEKLERVIKAALQKRKAAEENADQSSSRVLRAHAEETSPAPTSSCPESTVLPARGKARSRARATASSQQPPSPTGSAPFDNAGVVGASAALIRVRNQVEQVARSRATVLLYGETGTGKELFAQMIHRNSPRAGGAFIPVNCTAFPASLLESELFGFEKGAFTGAVERRIGRFEVAGGGTLFLDEIGEIDVTTQVKLLRFLETRTLERLGSQKPIHVDTRLVCATNKNLRDEVAKGNFREDLFYRLSVVQIELPPLRDRPDDIPLLLDHYFSYYSQENAMPPPALDAAARRALAAYSWPGNIRELRNLCENLVVMHGGHKLTAADLDNHLRHATPPNANAIANGNNLANANTIAANLANPHNIGNPFANAAANPGVIGNPSVLAAEGKPPLSVEESEKRLLRQALIESRGNRTKAALLLGVSRRTLHRRIAACPELSA